MMNSGMQKYENFSTDKTSRFSKKYVFLPIILAWRIALNYLL